MFLERRDKGKNYYRTLQDESLAMLQRLSGNIWTDFNAHDPGVTLLDLLNYALYELRYRYEFPLESYLTNPENRELNCDKMGLFPAQAIFSTSIVTIADYEALLSNGVDGVVACKMYLSNHFDYHVDVKIADGAHPEQVKQAIEQLYHANRNLCENLGEICIVDGGQLCPSSQEVVTDYAGLNLIPRPISTIEKNWMEYRSIQHDFPDCYGINEKGLPVGASKEHKAQIVQLKAYVLIFDYLIANSIAQAGHVDELLELSGKIPTNGLPTIDIAGIDQLVDPDRWDKNKVLDEAFLHLQKSRLLDRFDTMYGEDTNAFFQTASPVERPTANQKRARLIRRFPELNVHRFRSFNLLVSDSIPEIKKTMAAIQDDHPSREVPTINLLSSYNLRLISDRLFFQDYEVLLNIEFVFEDIASNWQEQEIQEIPLVEVVFEERRFYDLKRQLNLFLHNILFESFLRYGVEPSRYRMIQLPEKEIYLLVFKHPDRSKWLILGSFFEKKALVETANHLWEFLRRLNCRMQSFYLVEHILLRPETGETEENSEMAHNTLSLVIPRWTEHHHHRQAYEDLLMERLPAHLDIRFHWLDADRMYEFEKCYCAWRKAWAAKDKARIGTLSNELKTIIK